MSPHSLLLAAAATLAGIVVGCVGLIVGVGSGIESGGGPEPTLITGPSAADNRLDVPDQIPLRGETQRTAESADRASVSPAG